MKKIIQLLSLLVLLSLGAGCTICVDPDALRRAGSGYGGRYEIPGPTHYRYQEWGVNSRGTYHYDTDRNCHNNYRGGGYAPRLVVPNAPDVGYLLPPPPAEQNYWCAYCRGFYSYRHCH